MCTRQIQGYQAISSSQGEQSYLLLLLLLLTLLVAPAVVVMVMMLILVFDRWCCRRSVLVCSCGLAEVLLAAAAHLVLISVRLARWHGLLCSEGLSFDFCTH